ncbi:MAG: DUF3846 domain-containing protein [Bacteroidales bacterium]|nr:DUF3846 domain-containing protein [Candidatus Colimorpha merdihippi]
MAQLYKANGEAFSVHPKNGTDFELEELQEMVGGLIEIVHLPKGMIAVVNEEGMILELPLNDAMAVLFGMPLWGDVLVCKSEEVK